MEIFRDKWMRSKSATHGEIDEDGTRGVVFHQTCVVSWKDQSTGSYRDIEVTLRNGGYFTPTTKIRMNEVSREYNLHFSVYADRGDWFVSINGKILEFEEGMTFSTKFGTVNAE